MNPSAPTSQGLPSPGEIKTQFDIIRGLVGRGALDSERARRYRRVLHRGNPLECNGIIAELVILLDKSPGRNYDGGTHTPRVYQEPRYGRGPRDILYPAPRMSIGPTRPTRDDIFDDDWPDSDSPPRGGTEAWERNAGRRPLWAI